MTAEALPVFDQYTTVAKLWPNLPDWMSEDDARRISAYQVYEQIYWNAPETYKLVQRGSDADPIYIPNAMTIINTTNRYVGNGFSFVMDPDVGTPQEQVDFRNQLTMLFNREKFWTKFNSSKRYGLIRGDWMFHIRANPAKPAGSRIAIDEMDPATYIPVYHPDDPEKIIAAFIVEQFLDGDETKIKRQAYFKGRDPLNNDGSDTTIWSESAVFALDEWGDLDSNPLAVTIPLQQLNPLITAIPIYHMKNNPTPGDLFGNSELRGLERVMAAVNQAISDEELALALEGLGVYATDGGPPRDEAGNITNWPLGPGRVVEHVQGSSFERVNGIGTVGPYMDHMGFLIKSLKEASSTPDAAIGSVDVSVAESGIARLMKLGPMLSKAEEREVEIGDVTNQFLFGVRAWLAAYEGFQTTAYAIATFGDKLPDDKAARVKEILEIVKGGVASAEWGRSELAKMGYVFPENEGEVLSREISARAVAVDPWAGRAARELEELPTAGA